MLAEIEEKIKALGTEQKEELSTADLEDEEELDIRLLDMTLDE